MICEDLRVLHPGRPASRVSPGLSGCVSCPMPPFSCCRSFPHSFHPGGDVNAPLPTPTPSSGFIAVWVIHSRVTK